MTDLQENGRAKDAKQKFHKREGNLIKLETIIPKSENNVKFTDHGSSKDRAVRGPELGGDCIPCKAPRFTRPPQTRRHALTIEHLSIHTRKHMAKSLYKRNLARITRRCFCTVLIHFIQCSAESSRAAKLTDRNYCTALDCRIEIC